MKYDLHAITAQFDLGGEVREISPHGSGYINDTFASTVQTADGPRRFIHQRVNHNVFKEPEKVIENIERVTVHLRGKILAAGGDPLRETLNLVPARDGKSFYRDESGNYWRTFLFIEGARTYDVVDNPDQLYTASKAFGKFQKMVSDLPGPRLHETIVAFHDTRQRYRQFVEALEADRVNLAGSATEEVDFILARASDAPVLAELLDRGELPERIVHNDTKFNNVMIDDATGQAVCVVDLDTVMPGLAMYDFADSVRTGACPAAEDERDLSRVRMDMERFDRLAAGYLSEVRDFLSPAEIDRLAFAARLLTFEQAMRFLADYIAGDVYYKVHRPGHNLDRARTQIRLVEDMERKAEQMADAVARYR